MISTTVSLFYFNNLGKRVCSMGQVAMLMLVATAVVKHFKLMI